MSIAEKLMRERRARLAAQRMLEQTQRELFAANQRLALHAQGLTEQIIEQRQEVEIVRTEAEELKGENSRYLDALAKAHTTAVMAERRLWDSLETIDDGFAIYDHMQSLVAANGPYLAVFDGLEAVKPGISYPEVLRLAAEEGIVDTGGRKPDDWCHDMLERWHQEHIPAMVIQLFNGQYIKLIDRRARDGDMVCVAVNVTEAIVREARLKEAQVRADAANRAKSAFLANISHEIRTPMNGVVGMAELLCDSPLTTEQKIYAETIKSSGEALLTIINDVLDYSKIEAEKLTLYPKPFDLERCIQEVILMLLPGVQDSGVAILLDYDLFLPTRFIGDPGRIRQVLTNLIGNAVKFTQAGHVLIRVVGFEAGAGTQQLHVMVEDTGIGIAAEHVGHIFGEFNQVEDHSSRRFEGTGLGLAITRRLIELMGGTIWVDSEEGVGSSFGFRLTLPVAEAAHDLTLPPSGLRRALVVDDMLISRAIIERQLTALGLTVTLCRSGAEVLEELEADPDYDIMLTDHEMPDMDGLTLAARVRARGMNLPILLLSSNPGRAQGKTGAAQLTAILQKPVLRSDLFRRLKSLSAPEAELLPEPGEPRAMRVLAAEDNRTNQLVFRKMVQGLDIELMFANNGLEAVDLFESFAPDAIFMDISMPELDGREATRRIRAIETAMNVPRVPIVALTAHAMEGDASAILAAGLDRYMSKPLRKAAIIDAIESMHPAGARPLFLPDAAKPEAADRELVIAGQG